MITTEKIYEEPNIKVIEDLAHRIWNEHYTSIIGTRQVEYMLKKYQTADKIMSDIKKDGYIYYLARYNDKAVGYCAIRPDFDKNQLFLSKLYVEKQYRRKGLSKALLADVIKLTKDKKLDGIWLTVNKNNTDSIEAYKKMGFEVTDEVVSDIGCGYYMDDYVLMLDLREES